MSEERNFEGWEFFLSPSKKLSHESQNKFQGWFYFFQKIYFLCCANQLFFPFSISWNKIIKNQGEKQIIIFFINLEKSRIVFFCFFCFLLHWPTFTPIECFCRKKKFWRKNNLEARNLLLYPQKLSHELEKRFRCFFLNPKWLNSPYLTDNIRLKHF